jgi:hypothetical protein
VYRRLIATFLKSRYAHVPLMLEFKMRGLAHRIRFNTGTERQYSFLNSFHLDVTSRVADPDPDHLAGSGILEADPDPRLQNWHLINFLV